MSKFSQFSSVLISSSLLIFLAMPAMALGPAKTLDATSAATRKENAQQKIETARDARKEKVETKITNIREKIASREAIMKAKLETFKDKRKAEVAERVNTNLNAINLKQTSQMQKHLNTMSSILDRLETRVTAKDAIASTRANIATTSAALTSQAGKDYTIQVTSETRIKSDVQNQRDKLKTDLMTVRKMVIDAKQSVANAIRVAKSGKEATPSGQQ